MVLKREFGEELLDVIPMYEYREVDSLLLKLDEIYGKIHKLEAVLDQSSKGKKKPRNEDKLNALLKQCRQKKILLEESIDRERRKSLDNPVDVGGFALFSSHRAARLARRADIGLVPTIDMVSEFAPCPDSINFEALCSKDAEQRRALIRMMPVFVLLIVFPIGALTGALANLTVALCGGTPETNKMYSDAYCNNTPKFVSVLLTTVAPVSISAFWDTFVMPLCFYLCTQRLRKASSLLGLDVAIAVQLYVFTVFNTFFLGVLGGAAISGLGNALADGNVAEMIGERCVYVHFVCVPFLRQLTHILCLSLSYSYTEFIICDNTDILLPLQSLFSIKFLPELCGGARSLHQLIQIFLAP